MIDWPVAGGNIFLSVSAVALVAAPVYGATTASRTPRALEITAFGVTLFGIGCGLALSWRGVPGGARAAVLGPVALGISVGMLAAIGRVIRAAVSDDLLAAFAGMCAAIALTVAPFAAGSLTESLSLNQSTWLLFANPLVTTAAAAGIDVLHLDVVYRTSPLAHRGVALPAWTTACAVYAVSGLAAVGASRFLTRSH